MPCLSLQALAAASNGDASQAPIRRLTCTRHILPVMKAHVPGDQGPFPRSWPHPHNGMGGADGHPGDVLTEPGEHLFPHDPYAFLLFGLDREPFDEPVE